MKLQTNPNNWACVAASFAMALDMPVERLIILAGHDGSQVIFGAGGRSGFHPEEFFMLMGDAGFACMPFNVQPTRTDGYEIRNVYPCTAQERRNVQTFMDGRVGVVTGTNAKGRGHAMAWDGEYFFDPAGAGKIFSFGELETIGYTLDCFWWVVPIK